MILSRNMLKRVGESRHPCRTPTVVRNQSPMLPLKRTALVALLKRFFGDLDKVCADVVLLHGCPQSCMQNPVKGLLEVYEDMDEVEDLLCGTPSCSEACSSAMIFSTCGFNLFSMIFHMTLLG